MNFIYLKGNCPVCSGGRTDCRQSGELIHCRTDNPNPDYNYKGQSAIGFGLYKEAALEEEQSAEKKAERKQQWENDKRIRLDREKKQRAQSLSVADRNTEIRKILSQLTLTPEHRGDLRRRGLTDRQIDAGMFRSISSYQSLKTAVSPHLAGVAPNGRSLTNQGSGYICPAWSGNLMIGWQLRADIAENGKYKWATSKSPKRPSGPTSHLQNGELPITVCRPAVADPTCKSIGLAEGILKPWAAAQLSGQYFIGCSGGQFAGSAKTFKEELDKLSARLHTKMLVLYPDAGATSNANVMREYVKTYKLVSSWGYQTMVGWWGQKEKTGIDGIDDLLAVGEDWKITYLTWEDFAAIANGNGNKLVRMIEGIFGYKPKQPKAVTPSSIATPDITPDFYTPGDRLDTWKTAAARHKFIVDSSGTGTGKSYDSGLCKPADFDVDRIIYISKDHRNASTPSLRDWNDLEARHKGLTIDSLGNWRRAKIDDRIDTNASCDRTELSAVLREKNIFGSDTAGLMCPTCPSFEGCRAGEKFGFLHARSQTLKGARFRSHPDSLPQLQTFGYAPEEGKSKGTAILWEEWSETLAYGKDVGIREDDVIHTLAIIASANTESFGLMDLLVKLWEFVARKHEIPRWGLPHDRLKEIFIPLIKGEIDIDAIAQAMNPSDEVGKVLHGISEHGVSLQDLPANLRKSFASSDSELAAEADRIAKQWLVQFLEVLLGRRPGYLSLDRTGKLTLSIAHRRLIEIAHAAKVNIFLDATGNLDKFTKILGIDVDDVLCIAQEPVNKGGTVTIKQVVDHGRLGQHRGAEQTRAVEAMVVAIRQEDPNAAVIDFKRFSVTEGSGLNLKWLSESRGSNLAQNAKTLILVGAPCRPIAALAAEFTLLTGRTPTLDTEEVTREIKQARTVAGKEVTVTSRESIDLEFRNYIYKDVLANIYQGIGRLRANRRPGEELTIYLISDFALDLPVEVIRALDITLEAATPIQKLELAIVRCAEEIISKGQKLTSIAIAKYCQVSKQRLSQLVRELGYATAADFKKSLVLLLESNSKTRRKSEEYIPLAVEKQIELWATQIGSLPQSVILGLLEGVGMVSEVWARCERIFDWIGGGGRSDWADQDIGVLSW